MKKLKVLHIITRLELGGAQQNTLYTVTHLDPEAFTPVLAAGRGGILDDEARSANGLTVHFVPHLVRAISPLKDLRAFAGLYRVIRAEKPDIVHTHSSKAGILGRLAAWFARVPLIVHTVHGFSFNEYQPWFIRKSYILMERLTARLTDRLVVVTNEDTRKGLANKVGKAGQYLVIRSGIDTERFKKTSTDRAAAKSSLGLPPGAPVITTIGPFKPQKNLPDFITVAGYVAKRRPECRFLIIGDGEGRPLLEKLISQTGLAGTVKLLGWRRDIPDILAATDIFAMTSLWEGLPRAILEAMCAGLPVVANAIDGVKEIVQPGETGCLVEPFRCAVMANTILDLLERPDLRRAFGEKARAAIDIQYNINHMVRQQEALYRELCGPAAV